MQLRLRAPRLVLGMLVALAVFLALGLATDLAWRLRALIGWNIGAAVAVGAVLLRVTKVGPAELRRVAAQQDGGAFGVLGFTLAAATASLFAIGAEMPALKDAQGMDAGLRFALVLGTIVLSWALIQVVFALHYAHQFYRASTPPGMLDFPGDDEPDMVDFLYFAFTIGMTFQTSDVAIAHGVRLLALGHAVASFFYSTGVLAIAINLVAGAIGG